MTTIKKFRKTMRVVSLQDEEVHVQLPVKTYPERQSLNVLSFGFLVAYD